MNALRWQIRGWLSRLGREGGVGLGLIFVSVVFYAAALYPAESRLAGLRAQVAQLRHGHGARADRSAPVTQSRADRLAAYYQHFPPQTNSPELLAKIFHAAQAQNLELLEGKYRAKHERAGHLDRYQITLPVEGSYRQIRQFLAAVLREIPTAALDDVTFERRDVDNGTVKAQISLSLYVSSPT